MQLSPSATRVVLQGGCDVVCGTPGYHFSRRMACYYGSKLWTSGLRGMRGHNLVCPC